MKYLAPLVFTLFLHGPSLKEDRVQEENHSQVVKAHASQHEDFEKHCEFDPPKGLNSMIESASKEFDVPAKVIALTIYKESKCDPKALGSSGEIGLMQVNPSVWGDILLEKGFNINRSNDNVRAGTFILASLKKISTSTKEVFRRYNGSGPKAEAYAIDQLAMSKKLWKTKIKIPFENI